MANRNVCPPDNDPPPCPVALQVMKEQIAIAQNIQRYNWAELYHSKKMAEVYLKLGHGKGSKLIKYTRSKKDKKGFYLYSLSKAQVNSINKYEGTIEAIKLFLTPARTIKDIKTMKIDQ